MTFRKRNTKKPKFARRMNRVNKGVIPYRKSSSNNKGYLPFSSTLNCSLPYVQRNVLVSGALDVATINLFNLNSLHDPDQTGIGHQPFQYDQISPMYGSYIVNSVDINVEFSDPDIDGAWVGIVARTAFNTGGSASGASISQIGERKLTKMKPMNATGNQKASFHRKIQLHTLFGITKPEYQALRHIIYGAPVGSNPQRVGQLEVVILGLAGVVTATAVTRITYNATFFNYKTPNQS